MSEALYRAICGALFDASTRLRAEYPTIYAAVDAILADPDRNPPHDYPHNDFSGLSMQECAWCGDDFAMENRRPKRCCTRLCADSYKSWQRNLHSRRNALRVSPDHFQPLIPHSTRVVYGHEGFGAVTVCDPSELA